MVLQIMGWLAPHCEAQKLQHYFVLILKVIICILTPHLK